MKGKNGPILHVYVEEFLFNDEEYCKIKVVGEGKTQLFFQSRKRRSFFVLFADGGTGGKGGRGENAKVEDQSDTHKQICPAGDGRKWR